MARKYTKYAFSPGKTPLSAKTFNDRFEDIDLRLNSLELVKADWEQAVADLINIGLTSINDNLMPLMLQAQEILASAEIQLGNGSCTIIYHEDLVVEIDYQIDTNTVYAVLYDYYANNLLHTETGKLDNEVIWVRTYLYDAQDRCIGWNTTRNPIMYRGRQIR